MGVFEQFPYTNFHELNLDWIIKEVKEVDKLKEIIEQLNIKWEQDIIDTATAIVEEAIAQGTISAVLNTVYDAADESLTLTITAVGGE